MTSEQEAYQEEKPLFVARKAEKPVSYSNITNDRQIMLRREGKDGKIISITKYRIF